MLDIKIAKIYTKLYNIRMTPHQPEFGLPAIRESPGETSLLEHEIYTYLPDRAHSPKEVASLLAKAIELSAELGRDEAERRSARGHVENADMGDSGLVDSLDSGVNYQETSGDLVPGSGSLLHELGMRFYGIRAGSGTPEAMQYSEVFSGRFREALEKIRDHYVGQVTPANLADKLHLPLNDVRSLEPYCKGISLGGLAVMTYGTDVKINTGYGLRQGSLSVHRNGFTLPLLYSGKSSVLDPGVEIISKALYEISRLHELAEYVSETGAEFLASVDPLHTKAEQCLPVFMAWHDIHERLLGTEPSRMGMRISIAHNGMPVIDNMGKYRIVGLGVDAKGAKHIGVNSDLPLKYSLRFGVGMGGSGVALNILHENKFNDFYNAGVNIAGILIALLGFSMAYVASGVAGREGGGIERTNVGAYAIFRSDGVEPSQTTDKTMKQLETWNLRTRKV